LSVTASLTFYQLYIYCDIYKESDPIPDEEQVLLNAYWIILRQVLNNIKNNYACLSRVGIIATL
jgi:hypothetical protein